MFFPAVWFRFYRPSMTGDRPKPGKSERKKDGVRPDGMVDWLTLPCSGLKIDPSLRIVTGFRNVRLTTGELRHSLALRPQRRVEIGASHARLTMIKKALRSAFLSSCQADRMVHVVWGACGHFCGIVRCPIDTLCSPIDPLCRKPGCSWPTG